MYRLCLIAGLAALLTGAVFAQETPEAVNTDLVAGNNTFAFDLYSQLADKNTDNFMYSPYSISLALAMTYSGAQGDTATQMGDVMHFLPQDDQASAFGVLSRELDARAEPTDPTLKGDWLKLHVANALWGEQSITFKPDFLSQLQASYGAPLNLLDFINKPEPSRVTINDWVAKQTDDRIKDLVPQGGVNPDTRLVLTNAIYFNASWSSAFEPSATQDGPFTLADGSTVTVPLMHQQKSYAYAQGPDYQAVELPYLGEQVAMVAILPQDLAAFEATLDAERFASIRDSLVVSGTPVSLTMPRFKYESKFSLGQTLQDMGMQLAFSDKADFSAITQDDPLHISEVIHKSFISVDETGTEAAAATAVIMVTSSAMPATPIELRLDRPFVYVIYDRPTGSILFVGRVANPAE